MAAFCGGVILHRELLAHSARKGNEPQTYRAHIAGTQMADGVLTGARRRAEAMLQFHSDSTLRKVILGAIIDAATFHDLGKLDSETQAELRRGRGERLTWDHIDAGVAALREQGAKAAAWLVRAHHAPGLPSHAQHFADPRSRKLRGCRHDEKPPEDHQVQTDRTDEHLPFMLAAHHSACGGHTATAGKEFHGLDLRLALSCLVDADHSDTATYDSGWQPPQPASPRWAERLAALDAYVQSLGKGGGRDDLRNAFYRACREGDLDASLVACEGPVGIGKTTAVVAFLLRRAIATGARRLIIIAPYTAILSQTAQKLREALLLDDERDRVDLVIAEHHHRADFSDVSLRDLASLWSAPIILTTAVQFFGTLSSNLPAVLRKLHALPGSVCFIDEAHATLPTPLLPQNWRWLRLLAEDWSCSFVFASGSLARFWEVDDIAGDTGMKLEQLASSVLLDRLNEAESKRIRYESLGRLDSPDHLARVVLDREGPRLLIMNTVQSAAAMAKLLRDNKSDAMHLSTALCPRDRAIILEEIKRRLKPHVCYPSDWTLVATSLMEAGVDVSFRTAFRERFSAASLIQVGGRVNRHGEVDEGTTVFDFFISASAGLKAHPAARIPGEELERLLRRGRFQGQINPAELITIAMRNELRERRNQGLSDLVQAEKERNYPEVARLGRVIDADTCLVVVDPTLRDRIVAYEKVPAGELLLGSVQIWSDNISKLGLSPLVGRHTDIYWWPHAYDGTFLGYMDGALALHAIERGEALIL